MKNDLINMLGISRISPIRNNRGGTIYKNWWKLYLLKPQLHSFVQTQRLYLKGTVTYYLIKNLTCIAQIC